MIGPPLKEADKHNFETLQRAERNGDLCLLSAIRKSDQKPVALVCAMERRTVKGKKEFRPVPLAVMIEGNPFEDFEDPTQ